MWEIISNFMAFLENLDFNHFDNFFATDMAKYFWLEKLKNPRFLAINERSNKNWTKNGTQI